jgi:hypothetical protein
VQERDENFDASVQVIDKKTFNRYLRDFATLKTGPRCGIVDHTITPRGIVSSQDEAVPKKKKTWL